MKLSSLSGFLIRNSIVVLLVLVAISARLYRIDYPLLDWHSWRQADTASVSYRFVTDGINLLYPKYHDLSEIPSGMHNPEGYRMVEFPIINAVVAIVVQIIPGSTVTVVSRVVSILFSAGTLICLYHLTRHVSGKKVAFLTGLVYALLPYAVFYGRTALPEPGMVFFGTASITSWYFWMKYKQLKWYIFTALSFTLALLIKPFALFLGPALFGVTFSFLGKQSFKYWPMYLLGITLAPLVAWRTWIANFPEGIPGSDWLYNGMKADYSSTLNKIIGYDPNGTRYHPFWFRWLGYERLVKMFLGFGGVILLPFSLLKLEKKELYIYGTWWLGMISYLTIIAHGNVHHDYYQQLLIPILAITIARGTIIFDSVLVKKLNIPGFISIGLISGIYIVSLILSWTQVKGYFNVNHWEYYHAGQAVQRFAEADDLVIAPNVAGDTAFLFQTKRNGWPIGVEIEDKMDRGAKYYVSTNYDDVTRALEEDYLTVEKTPEYTIIDLSSPILETP